MWWETEWPCKVLHWFDRPSVQTLVSINVKKFIGIYSEQLSCLSIKKILENDAFLYFRMDAFHIIRDFICSMNYGGLDRYSFSCKNSFFSFNFWYFREVNFWKRWTLLEILCLIFVWAQESGRFCRYHAENFSCVIYFGRLWKWPV